jgi:hypothetical protein
MAEGKGRTGDIPSVDEEADKGGGVDPATGGGGVEDGPTAQK